MNEFEIFLISDIGERYLGTVKDGIQEPEIVLNEIRNFISDIASDLAFGDEVELSKVFTVELRNPQ
ncbi:hypothetical protein LCGC14_2028620 [marine sediment metagenome]|uniref:Uncharacterized protein n=1 Tax=marine sediment metagenome TaxID=412755 RepID=A0A0F9EV93_9ZZZZ